MQQMEIYEQGLKLIVSVNLSHHDKSNDLSTGCRLGYLLLSTTGV